MIGFQQQNIFSLIKSCESLAIQSCLISQPVKAFSELAKKEQRVKSRITASFIDVVIVSALSILSKLYTFFMPLVLILTSFCLNSLSK